MPQVPWEFALGFPALMYALWAGVGRVRTARWLEREDADGLVSRSPLPVRLAGAGCAAIFGGMLAFFIDGARPGGWVVVAPAGTRGPALVGDWAVGLLGAIVLFVLPIGLCLWAAGPYRLCLCSRRREFALTRGLPLLARTRRGPTEGAEFRVGRRGSGCCVFFRPQGWRLPVTVEVCATEAEARSLVRRLTEQFGSHRGSVRRNGA